MATPTETLDLTALDDAAFARLYAARIEPCFADNEADRQKAVKTFYGRGLIGACIAIAATLIMAYWSQDLRFSLITAIAGAVWVGWYAYSPLQKIGARVKIQSLTSIAEAMSATYDLGGFDPPALARFRALNLLPGYNRSQFEDLFTGAHRGASYDFYEAHLQQHRSTGKSSSTVTVFRGQLIRLKFPRNFSGVTVVRRDAGVFNALGGFGELKRVGLVDPKFEKVFEVYATDQVEARFLVHPAFMERLLDLEAGLHGKRLRCAFENGDLLIAIEGGNLFEIGSLFKPLVDPARARKIVTDLSSVLRVIDAVLTAQAQR